MSATGARQAEILGALTLATDLAAGLGNETALKVCLVATSTARELGVTGEPLRAVFNASLVRFLGCAAYAHETARLHSTGDDAAALAALSLADTASVAQVFRAAVRGLAAKGSPAARAKALLNFIGDPRLPRKLATAHCQLAGYLAGQLQLGEEVLRALDEMYERFDGKGQPRGVKGDSLSLAARLIHLGFRVVAHHTLLGPQEALEAVAERAGGELDPAVCAAFKLVAPRVLDQLSAPSVWEFFLDSEPAPRANLDGSDLLRACGAFALYADMKSPYTLGHSPAVAALARSAAGAMGFGEAEQTTVEVAALLHDLGRISVPNGIWDKHGPLSAAERERVEQHTYHSERILNQSAALAEYAQLAGMHHERLDGSGYHRRLAGAAAIPMNAAIIAAADAYRCKLEERPYRRALEPEVAATYLAALGRAGKLDRRAVEAVLEVAGQRPAGRRPAELPAHLSEREAEVLVLVARGLTNKQAGERLHISARTVQNHLANVFEKTGVANRAAAALFAARHGLLE